VLKKTTASEILVRISGLSLGYNKRSTGIKTKPPPAPMRVPKAPMTKPKGMSNRY
jgi:hypothetical protein